MVIGPLGHHGAEKIQPYHNSNAIYWCVSEPSLGSPGFKFINSNLRVESGYQVHFFSPSH